MIFLFAPSLPLVSIHRYSKVLVNVIRIEGLSDPCKLALQARKRR